MSYGGSSEYDRQSIAQMLFNRGYQAFEERNYVEAYECYKKCIEMDPKDIVARFELAETYIVLGRFDEAKQEICQSN